jgi:hypothetical protein
MTLFLHFKHVLGTSCMTFAYQVRSYHNEVFICKDSVKIVTDSVYFDRTDTSSLIIYRTTFKKSGFRRRKSREGGTLNE